MIETFDVVAYLEDRDLEVHHPGEKNVSTGWVNIECIFDFCGDPSWHLGINLDTKFYSCWRCGESGHITKLIQILEGGCSWAQANTIIDEFQDLAFQDLKRDIRIRSKECVLPKEAGEHFPAPHLDYLTKRGFDAQKIISKYSLKACYNMGKYKFRIIIPIFMGGNLVCFTSRDITGQSDQPHKHCKNEYAIIPAKECIYNIDSVEKKMLILESPTDVWNIGDGAAGLFGLEVTSAQVNLLTGIGVEEAYVMFDAGRLELRRAEKLAGALSGLIKHVEVLELDQGDPAEMSFDEVENLRTTLGL